MASIEVDAAGLTALAVDCEGYAARIGSISAPPVSASAFQPSVAAVETAHADIAALTARLVARIQSTGIAASFAAAEYIATDSSSASAIAGISTNGTPAV